MGGYRVDLIRGVGIVYGRTRGLQTRESPAAIDP